MSAICGFRNASGQEANPKELEKMVCTLNHWEADTVGQWSRDDVAMGHLMLYNTPESLEEILPFYDEVKQLTITADARLDYREELIHKLGLPSDQTWSDSLLILEAYKYWGDDCVHHLLGDFAFVIFDKSANQFFCARDHVGVKSLFYYFQNGFFAFASEMKGILCQSAVEKTIDEQYIVDYLAKIFPDVTGTFYKNIVRLEPAHRLIVKDGTIEKDKYWSLDSAPKRDWKSPEEVVGALRVQMEKAVWQRLRSAYPVGSELSGGLDSSAVTSLAQKELKKSSKEVYSYSNIMGPKNKETTRPFADEREDIQSVVSELGIEKARMVTGLDCPVDKLIADNANFLDQPPKTFSAFYSDGIYRAAAADGVRTLLTGTGGDEIVSIDVTGRKSYYRKNNNIFKRAQQVFRNATRSGQSPWRPVLSTLLNENKAIARIIRWIKGTEVPAMGAFRLPGIQPGIIEDFELLQRIRDVKKIKLPKSIQEFQSQVIHYPKYCEGMLIEELVTRKYNIEYRYPLLDVPLLELAHSFPEEWLSHNHVSRYLFKEAMKDIVPHGVIFQNTKHAVFNVPSVIQRMVESREQLAEELERLKSRLDINRYISLDYACRMMADFDSELEEVKVPQINFAIQVLILSKFLNKES